MNKCLIISLAMTFQLLAIIAGDSPYFLEKCYSDDEEINECLKYSGNKLIQYLRQDGGIPELGIEEIEPVVIDEISIALGEGEDAYRAVFTNIEAYGVSNLTVANIRSDIETYQFQLTYEIPRIRVKANFKSSGVLLLIKAAEQGDYWGDYEGVRCKVYFKGTPYEKDDDTYISLDSVKMDFSVKDITMGVDNSKQNRVIQAAMNLFINSNAQELLKEMKPALKRKLTVLLTDFMENLFAKVPYNQWIE
ncbi:unnamed protein product [Diamesa hyperborea]